VHRQGQPLGEFIVRMPGQHNVLNCLAVIAISDELAVPLDVVKEALATFRGVARRFSVVAEVGGVTLVDDYGHHPEEIRATLNAARNAFQKRVVVAFQPHRYTRTQALFQDFARAFDQADQVYVADVYAAGEAPLPGITSEALARAIESHGHRHVEYVPNREGLVARLAEAAAPGDVVIALGAGDVNRVLAPVADELRLRLAGKDA
jgi:UDP-N-acetylmuramate--alanine ligase